MLDTVSLFLVPITYITTVLPFLYTSSPSPSLPEMSMLAVPRIQFPDAHVSMRTMYEEADRIALKYIQDGVCVCLSVCGVIYTCVFLAKVYIVRVSVPLMTDIHRYIRIVLK